MSDVGGYRALPLRDFMQELGFPPGDCSVYCDKFMVLGYEDARSIKEFISLRELLSIDMKMGHLKRLLMALLRMEHYYGESREYTDLIGQNDKRFEIIDRIVNNVSAVDVVLWLSQESLFEDEINKKVHKFFVVDNNCISGKILNDVNVLTRLAHADIDSVHLLELSYRFRFHHMNNLINQIVGHLGMDEAHKLPQIDTRTIKNESYAPDVIKPLLSEKFNQFKQGSELELPTGFPYDYDPSTAFESLSRRSPADDDTIGIENEAAGTNDKLKLTSVLPILPMIPLKNLTLHQSKSGYLLLKEIGRGGCGVIHSALFMPTLKPFALKVIELSDPNKCKQLVKELEVIQRMSKDYSVANTSYILLLYDYFHDYESNIVTLVLEYMGGGSLQRMIDLKYVGCERDVAVIAWSMLHALRSLHSIGIIHRDIKPGNILISSNGAVKLADFGISSYQNESKKNETFVGTLIYMSPERIQGMSYDCASDVWALGICLYVYSTGIVPFCYNRSYWDLVETISRGLSASSISLLTDLAVPETVLDFILLSTKANPSDRTSIDELLEHSLLRIILHDKPPTLSKALTLTISDGEIIDIVDLVLEWQLENIDTLNINTIGHIPDAHIEHLAVELGYNALSMHSIFQSKSKILLQFLQPLYTLAKSDRPKFKEIVSRVKNKTKLIYLMYVLDKLKAAGVAVLSETDIVSITDVATSDIPDPIKPMTIAERNRQRTQKLLNSIYKDSYRFEVAALASMMNPDANTSQQGIHDAADDVVMDKRVNKEEHVSEEHTPLRDNNLQLIDAPDALTHSTIDNIIADLRGNNGPGHVRSHKYISKMPQAFQSDLPIIANYRLDCIALPKTLYLESPLKRVNSTNSLCGTPIDNMTQLLHQSRSNHGHRSSGGVLSRPRVLECATCQRNDCAGCQPSIKGSYDLPRIQTKSGIDAIRYDTVHDDEKSTSNIVTVVNQNYETSPTESESSLSF